MIHINEVLFIFYVPNSFSGGMSVLFIPFSLNDCSFHQCLEFSGTGPQHHHTQKVFPPLPLFYAPLGKSIGSR